MKSNAQILKTLKKGDRIDKQYVAGTLVLKQLTRFGTNLTLVQDPNTEDVVFNWTVDGTLYAYIPIADRQPSKWIRFTRAEDLSPISGGLAAFHVHGREFGGPKCMQTLGTVQHTIADQSWQFCDIARAGANDAPDDNEADVANGPTLAMRWIHLVSSTTLKGAKHVMLTMNEDGENVFGTQGDIATNLWLDGEVIDPENLTIESE